MDNTIKFNFLNFTEGNLENDKSNLLMKDTVVGQKVDGSQFTLDGKTIENISIVDEENINPVIDITNKDLESKKLIKKQNNKKSDTENELVIADINVNIENTEPNKIISLKNTNDQAGLVDKKIIFKKENQIHLIDTVVNKNSSNRSDIE